MKVLVLNCGSSSVKFELIETSLQAIEQTADRTIARGAIEKIGTNSALINYYPAGAERHRDAREILDHETAVNLVVKLLTDGETPVISSPEEIDAVGHRITHGGERFDHSVLIDEEVARAISDCIDLAPLHNPHNLKGYQIAKKLLPEKPHAAVFDTAFHQSIPPEAHLYAIPYVLYKRHGIRRYGFHGTSHRYMIFRIHKLLGLPRNGTSIVSCHLGSGCSVCAIRDGLSIDTSMGFTPLEGLVMGTRSGDLDPALLFHIMAKEDLGTHEINTMLNKHSGLIGLSGVSNDMREIQEEIDNGNQRAIIARDVFVYRAAKYIASYMAMIGKQVHAIGFTAGIGENSPDIRRRICERLSIFGIELDEKANAECIGTERRISTENSRTAVYAIPTSEELVIARDTVRCVEGVL